MTIIITDYLYLTELMNFLKLGSLVAVAVLNFTTQLTAVAATSAGNYTVVFLGTNEGHLKKVTVNDLLRGLFLYC